GSLPAVTGRAPAERHLAHRIRTFLRRPEAGCSSGPSQRGHSRLFSTCRIGCLALRDLCERASEAFALSDPRPEPEILGWDHPLGTNPAVSRSAGSPSTAGTRFVARKSTNTLSLGARCRLDGHRIRRGPERSV